MFLMFASPKASAVLYKAGFYEPSPIENPRYTPVIKYINCLSFFKFSNGLKYYYSFEIF